MQSALKAFAFLLLGLAWLGCSGGGSEEFCADNADCETRLTCFQNRCLPLEQVPEGLLWEVIPSGHAPPMVLNTPQRTQPLPLRFCEAGVVGNTGELGLLRVDAEGEKRGLPGVCTREQFWVEGEFSIPLSPGWWRFTFHPENAPPIVRRFEVRNCEEAVRLGTLQAPAHSTLRFLPIHGEDYPLPRCGIRAQAFDPESGEVLSEAVEIRLAPDGQCRPPRPEGWALEVANPRGEQFALVLDSATASAPVMRQRVFYLRWEPDSMEPQVLSTESQAAERVLLDLADPNGLPVDGARIQAVWPWPETENSCLGPRFRAAPDEGYGAFRSAPAMPTHHPGTYELWLPPGPYHFQVVPPAATDLAAKTWEEPVTVRAGGGNVLPLRLTRKAVVEGGVRSDHPREPLAETRLRALPLQAPQRSVETRTDAQGNYRLQLDPGKYLLLADPPGRGRARVWSFLEAGEGETLRVDPLVGQPRVVAGLVRNEEGPLGLTLIRAWDVNGEIPVVAGEAVTDSSGRFVVRLRR